MVGRKRKQEGTPEPDPIPVNKKKRIKFTLENGNLPPVDHSGVVLVTGAGDVGQLGLGPDILERVRPTLVKLEHEIVDICAGGMHTVCLTKAGKVMTFGCNDEGALGRTTDGKEDAEFTPDFVELPGKVIQISAGDSHTAALLDDGRVFVWGTFRDSHGNLGLTITGNEKLPFLLMEKVHVVKIGSGADHVVFLTNLGDIWTCGCGEQGQLGRTNERTCGRTARGAKGKGQIGKLLEPAKISLKPSLRLKFDDIWAGTYCTFAKVADKKTIYVFGLNNYNQIGLSKQGVIHYPTLSKDFSGHLWRQITSAQHHTIALDENGKVFVIGRKEYGRLGLGKDCEDATSLVELKSLKDKIVKHVSCGSSTSFCVSDEGELYAWGMGTNGQLGTGEEEDCFEPTLIKSKQLLERKVYKVSAGGQHTVALATNPNNNGDIK